MAFYFLLRSGEYTIPRKVARKGKMVHATRTEQFSSERYQISEGWQNAPMAVTAITTLDSRFLHHDNIQPKEWTHMANIAPQIHRTQWHSGSSCSPNAAHSHK